VSVGWLIVLCFLWRVIASGFVISNRIGAVKRKLTKWDSNSTIWFIISMGNFGAPQIDMWGRRCGYDEDQAKIMVKHQMLCVFGIFLAYITGGSAIAGYKILMH
jgi:hypothetical protein